MLSGEIKGTGGSYGLHTLSMATHNKGDPVDNQHRVCDRHWKLRWENEWI